MRLGSSSRSCAREARWFWWSTSSADTNRGTRGEVQIGQLESESDRDGERAELLEGEICWQQGVTEKSFFA
jgi:hypothetical protein